MADTKMLLWLDFESSGLLDQTPSPTMLEVAWVVTDAEGDQLTSLSQAFCALPVDPTAPPVVPQPISTGTGGYWEHQSYPHAKVREMHEINSLTDEWANTAYGRGADRVLRAWPELERLLLDDLHEAGWWARSRHEVQLAGGGVANYESRFVNHLMPRVFRDDRMHYRTHDTSIILGGMRTRLPLLPGSPDHLLDAMRGKTASWPDWREVLVSPTRYDADDVNSYAWADLERDNHRAAVGVARALMAHRLLPELSQLFTTAPVL